MSALEGARSRLEAMEQFAGSAEDRGEDVALYVVGATIAAALIAVAESLNDLSVTAYTVTP